jgi:hypothetical protein
LRIVIEGVVELSPRSGEGSNLPTLGLPGPAGFEVPDFQGFWACLGAFSFGWLRLDWVRFAESGTRFGTPA